MSNSRELPKYKCHKEVWALKIKAAIVSAVGKPGADLIFEDESYLPCYVSSAWVDKHRPQSGGYYVLYPDGYKSYSPAAAFEEGYTLIK